ncbi:inositol monophosphatase [bacterium]|nr:inositol monophosphatase [bacterium]
MKNYLDIAIEMVREAGQLQLDHLGKVKNLEFKGKIDIVTEVDKKCEELIVSRIQKEFSGHDILAEEGHGKRTKSDYRWIVDPLDGTVNYAHTYPLFGPAIALEYKNEVILGVFYDPNRDELFAAEKFAGATLNGGKIHVSKASKVQNSLLATGFAYSIQEGNRDNNLDNFGKFILKARAVRRPGVATVDLVYVACGRLDGFWELHLKPWDLAAGALIVEEAGGRTSNFDGTKLDIYGIEVLASNGLIHEEMMRILYDGTIVR